MSMLKPIVKQWNNVIAPDLFSLRDSSTGVATQWRAASSAFQDMEAMRDERITHEMSCVGNHMRRCNKIKCMDQQTRKYRKCVETSCSGTKHARCLHGTGVAKLHRDAVITCQNIRARRCTVVADESFYELWKQKLDEDNSITIVWDNETTQTKRKIRTALADLSNKIISSSDCKRNRDFFLPSCNTSWKLLSKTARTAPPAVALYTTIQILGMSNFSPRQRSHRRQLSLCCLKSNKFVEIDANTRRGSPGHLCCQRQCKPPDEQCLVPSKSHFCSDRDGSSIESNLDAEQAQETRGLWLDRPATDAGN